MAFVVRSGSRGNRLGSDTFRTDAFLSTLACLLGILLFLIPATARAADLKACRDHVRHGRYADAIKEADAAIEDGTYLDDWYLLKAKAHTAIGQDNEAIKVLDAAALRFSLSILVRHTQFEAYERVGRKHDALLVLERINRMIVAAPWRYSDSEELVTQGRVALAMGADARQVLELLYDRAIKLDPENTDAYLASGQLALDKNDDAEAARAFERGLRHDAEHPDLLFGLAQALASSDGPRTAETLDKLLEINPNYAGALLMQADHFIDSERYEHAVELLDKVLAVNPIEPSAWAYFAVLAHLDADAIGEHEYRDFALRRRADDPAVDHLIGRKLSRNYRFSEGAAYQRAALAMQANYLPARKQLAQDLLRLGNVEEGWKLVHAVYEDDGYDVVAFNLVTLHDRMAEFTTLRDDDFIVRMSASEAKIYGRRVMALLHRAKRALCDKYGLTLDGPVTVEIFPDQKDFAIRTFGLPGGVGYLGVCFGNVVTANSPASQGASPSNWEAVLWHEFCHVVTLNLTNNKMPRWLSEGISVYEEKQANKTWGQAMNARYRKMIMDGELTPISRLSAAFLRPKSGLHLNFAYYESSLVVEYMIQEFGLEKLRAVLQDLGKGIYINQAIENHMGPMKQIDKAFDDFARKRAEQLAPGATFEDEAFTRDVQRDPDALKQWVEDHPSHYPGLRVYASWLASQERYDEAVAVLTKAIELYPTETGGGSAYAMLAQLYRELGKTELERKTLQTIATLDADAVDVYMRLMELATEAEQWSAVRDHAQQMLAVNPLLPEPHRRLARAAEELGEHDTAIDAYRTLVTLDTPDPAGVHFALARLLHAKDDPSAKRHLLKALEEAPRYRDAHRMLLQITKQVEPQEKPEKSQAPPPAEPDEPKRPSP